jgi:tetratricopeptide (TPR) repeat protein
MNAARVRAILGALATAALALAVYWPALDGKPLWDDDGHLTAPELRTWAGLGRIWTEPGATQQYYPLLHSAFWLEHRLWGDAVRGYHLANLAQHLAAAGLLGLLLRRLGVPGAGWAAAVFAVHPVHVESVAWISEQKNTLSLGFMLGAALAYLRFDATRRRRDYLAASALFGAALLTKTVTATLPAALLVVLWWRRGRIGRGEVASLLPWLVAGAMAGLFTAAVERHAIGAVGAEFGGGPVERAVRAGQAGWFYLGNAFWPANQVFVYPRWTVDAGIPAQWFPLLAAGGATAGLGVWCRRARAPLAAWLLFWGLLFPALGFVAVYPFRYAWVADHFQYHANLVPVAVLGAALAAAARHARGGWIAAGAAVAALALLAARQAPQYRDAATLFATTLRRNPESAMAHNNLGLIRAAQGDRPAALRHFRQAVVLRPDDFDARNNLGLTLTQAGLAAAALPHLERAVALDPAAGRAHNNRGIALAALRRPLEAVAAFRTAAHLMPDSPSAQENLAKAFRLAGYAAEAEAAARRAAELRRAR